VIVFQSNRISRENVLASKRFIFGVKMPNVKIQISNEGALRAVFSCSAHSLRSAEMKDMRLHDWVVVLQGLQPLVCLIYTGNDDVDRSFLDLRGAMENLSYWLVFFSAAFALNISPGPDLIYILSRTIAQGRNVGIASSLGVCTGALVHVGAAALGLSAVLATSAVAFSLVKYLGAAYLVYLGVNAFRSAGIAGIRDSFPRDPACEANSWKAFKQGVLIDVLNPKVAIFFMAFLPQFVRPGSGHPTIQIVILGMLVILVAMIVETAFVLAAGQTTTILRKNRKLTVMLNRLLGSVFIALGIRLALAGPRG
jgi:threonine/homoserine/homoserine lactone efflux protein